MEVYRCSNRHTYQILWKDILQCCYSGPKLFHPLTILVIDRIWFLKEREMIEKKKERFEFTNHSESHFLPFPEINTTSDWVKRMMKQIRSYVTFKCFFFFFFNLEKSGEQV